MGYCLTFLPTVTILSQYFNHRRALVTAVASTGESLSMFALAPGEWEMLVENHVLNVFLRQKNYCTSIT